MSFLSKFVPTFFSATNENTIALASAKFDFSLIKVEAPVEFGPLGIAISKGRKHEAEDGVSHQTARRLGALFEQIIPSTPKLISAYGKRISEIVNTPGVNPEGLGVHGPFRDYIGVDATAIWAAATSGIPSIAMYMLASLIAQLLDHKEAISLWVELVAERKKEIHQQSSANYNISEFTFFSSRQNISRQDLATWDNSARSWLRSADMAKSKEKKQLQLIVENLSIPHRSGTSTYDKVIGLLLEAMRGVEDLMNGMPQEVQTKSVPLALLAWHLFPDLLVLSDTTKHISFKDPLFPPGATLTLGALTQSKELPAGNKWSLALSHFQYYGAAVQVSSEEDSSRVTMLETSIIAFGALMAMWDAYANCADEMKEAANWFAGIFRALNKQGQTPYQWSRAFRRNDPLKLLFPLFEAAEEILKAKEQDELSDLIQLYRFGQRRFRSFWTHESNSRDSHGQHLPPFLGLRNQQVIETLCHAVDSGHAQVGYCRKLAQSIGLSRGEGVIVQHLHNRIRMISIPSVQSIKRKRGYDGKQPDVTEQKLWNEISYHCESNSAAPEWVSVFPGSFRPKDGFVFGTARPSGDVDHNWQGYIDSIEGILQWHNVPSNFLPEYSIAHKGLIDGTQIESTTSFGLIWQLAGVSLYLNIEPYVYQSTKLCKSRVRALGLDVMSWQSSARSLDRIPEDPLKAHLRYVLSLRENISFNKDSEFNDGSDWDFGEDFDEKSDEEPDEQAELDEQTEPNEQAGESVNSLIMIDDDYMLSVESALSLRALWFSRTTFRHIDGPVISTRAFGGPMLLGDTQWTRPHLQETGQLSRSRALACVVYMDSGTIDLELSCLRHAIAVSRENCIYVAKNLVEDPDTLSQRNKTRIRRLVGNLGKSGTSVLVAPTAPLIRQPSTEFKIVNHEMYDFVRRDSFKGTSLHLQFSDWTQPINISGQGHSIDSEAQFVEAIIKVRDRGEWVADLNVLSPLSLENCWARPNKSRYVKCPGKKEHMKEAVLISLDNWEELLDPPSRGVSIFRSHGNWAARLAAISILKQKDLAHRTLVISKQSTRCVACQSRELALLYRAESCFVID